MRSLAKLALWVAVLYVIAVGLQSCVGGRLMFRPKPPLENIPASKPKFIPSDERLP